MRRALLVVGWIWALPTSLIGLLIAACTGARPYRWRQAGVWQWIGHGPVWDKFTKDGFGAITFGTITIFSDALKDDATMIRHERAHTIQAFGLGVLFLPAYLLMGAMEWAAGRDGYRADPLEVDAYTEEKKPDQWG
jgi:hypothetical protein